MKQKPVTLSKLVEKFKKAQDSKKKAPETLYEQKFKHLDIIRKHSGE